MKKSLSALVILFSAMSTVVHAGDEKDEKDAKAIQMPADAGSSRWSVSGGVSLSSIKTTFRADPGLNPGTFGAGLGGSDSLFTGTTVVYADGTVGVNTGNGNVASDPSEGTVGFLGGTSHLVAVDPNDNDYTLSQVQFHSFGGAVSPFGSDSDTGLAVGPYVKLAYLLKQWDEANSISLFAQYTFTTAYNAGAPASNSSIAGHTFTYDVFNGDVSNTVGGAAVYDAATFNTNIYPSNFAGTGLRMAIPASEVSSAASPLSIYEPESINIYLHSFTLGLDFTHDLGNRVHLVLSTGPSLNLFDYDYKTPGIAVVDGFAVQYANPQNDEGQKLRFGWVGRLGVKVDLDSRKIYFAELSGEYHYIQDFDVNTNIGSATVHPSSWGVNLGLGRNF